MPETKYDAAILQQYADDLYAQARWVIFSTASIYGLVTFGVTFLISNVGTAFKSNFNLSLQPGILLIALIGAVVGVSAGRKKAFKLKLEAQTLLCQRQVELNTRGVTKPESVSAAAGR
jgi:hypothetical protein